MSLQAAGWASAAISSAMPATVHRHLAPGQATELGAVGEWIGTHATAFRFPVRHRPAGSDRHRRGPPAPARSQGT